MTHYIRDKKNNTIVTIEATKKDITCTVSIDNYTRHLLSLPVLRYQSFMFDMDRIQEIQGLYFETAKRNRSNPDRKDKTPNEFAKQICEEVCKVWDLCYMTD